MSILRSFAKKRQKKKTIAIGTIDGLNRRSSALTWPGAGDFFAERSIVEPPFGNEKNVEDMR
jgi:hypothetical protein